MPISKPIRTRTKRNTLGLFDVDNDVKDYILAIRDNGGSIGLKAIYATNEFVKGCKRQGIWNSLVDVGLLAGPDNLNGALVKLKNAAGTPRVLTNFNFVEGDYNSRTGLIGNGSSKYLDTKHLNSFEPQNSSHKAIYATMADSTNAAFYIGCGTSPSLGRDAIIRTSSFLSYRSRIGTPTNVLGEQTSFRFIGISRGSSLNYLKRIDGADALISATSEPTLAQNIQIFAGDNTGFSNSRISFYSIGFDINLEILDTLVTAYNAALN